ncbi:MAG: MlaD family protein, partial [Muribaculaceae bacterium]|nr:MlaD family protein [Muribaculaceae bacterium]
MKNRFGKEFKIGLAVIIAIALLFFGIDYLKGINIFRPTNFYEVYYDNIAGLEVSAPVTINGFKVGQVREVAIDYKNPGKVKVVLALNKELKLREGTVASLGSTLLSGAYIILQPSEKGEYLSVGSRLKGIESSDLMSSLTNEMMPKVNALLPRIDSLLINLNSLVSDPTLVASINRLDGITGNVYSATGRLDATMAGVNQQLPLILRNVGRASIDLDTITNNLSYLSRDLRQLPLKPTMENVERITTNLDEFSRQLKNPNSTLGKLTSDPELYNQLNRVSADIDSLIVDIKKNPKRYISIK